MILVNGVGPGTYGPFNMRPGNYILIGSAASGASNVELWFTDELGATYRFWAFSVSNVGVPNPLPGNNLTVVVPAGVTGVNITANPVS